MTDAGEQRRRQPPQQSAPKGPLETLLRDVRARYGDLLDAHPDAYYAMGLQMLDEAAEIARHLRAERDELVKAVITLLTRTGSWDEHYSINLCVPAYKTALTLLARLGYAETDDERMYRLKWPEKEGK